MKRIAGSILARNRGLRFQGYNSGSYDGSQQEYGQRFGQPGSYSNRRSAYGNSNDSYQRSSPSYGTATTQYGATSTFGSASTFGNYGSHQPSYGNTNRYTPQEDRRSFTSGRSDGETMGVARRRKPFEIQNSGGAKLKFTFRRRQVRQDDVADIPVMIMVEKDSRPFITFGLNQSEVIKLAYEQSPNYEFTHKQQIRDQPQAQGDLPTKSMKFQVNSDGGATVTLTQAGKTESFNLEYDQFEGLKLLLATTHIEACAPTQRPPGFGQQQNQWDDDGAQGRGF